MYTSRNRAVRHIQSAQAIIQRKQTRNERGRERERARRMQGNSDSGIQEEKTLFNLFAGFFQFFCTFFQWCFLFCLYQFDIYIILHAIHIIFTHAHTVRTPYTTLWSNWFSILLLSRKTTDRKSKRRRARRVCECLFSAWICYVYKLCSKGVKECARASVRVHSNGFIIQLHDNRAFLQFPGKLKSQYDCCCQQLQSAHFKCIYIEFLYRCDLICVTLAGLLNWITAIIPKKISHK